MADGWWDEEDMWWEMQDPPWAGLEECHPSEPAALASPSVRHSVDTSPAIQCEDQKSTGDTGIEKVILVNDYKEDQTLSSASFGSEVADLKNSKEKNADKVVGRGLKDALILGCNDDCSDDQGLPLSRQRSSPTLKKGNSNKRTRNISSRSSQEEQRVKRVMTLQNIGMRSAMCTPEGKAKVHAATSAGRPFTGSPVDSHANTVSNDQMRLQWNNVVVKKETVSPASSRTMSTVDSVTWPVSVCSTVSNSPVSVNNTQHQVKRQLQKKSMSKLVTVPQALYDDLDMRKQLLSVGPMYGVGASFLSYSRNLPKLEIKGDPEDIVEAATATYETIINLQSKLFNQSEVPVRWPVEWEDGFDASSKNAILKIVTPGSQEYFTVLSKCLETIPQIQLVQLERIQNPWLWKQYALHRTRMSEKGSQAVNEMDLFHGTRQVNPQSIYNSEEGFDMRFSSPGAWGTGCYFAVNASYSAMYSHPLPNGLFQMFLAKVLTGDSAQIASDPGLRMPPLKKKGQRMFGQTRFDTVTGISGDSQIFVTYKNDKAYPFYLITFTL